MKSKRNTNLVGGPNTAKVTEVFNLGSLNMQTPYEFNIPGISPNSRSAIVAPAFGLYRIAKVQYTFRPFYDTYTPNLGQAGGGQIGNQPDAVPYMYWKINRYGDSPAAWTAEFLREQGSKPIRVDDKLLTWSYKPNVLLADAGATAAGLNGGSGQVKVTPWLSTDAQPGDNAFALSNTLHYGHLMYIEGAASGDAKPIIGQLEAKVIYEFKNPRGIESNASATPKKVKGVGKMVSV